MYVCYNMFSSLLGGSLAKQAKVIKIMFECGHKIVVESRPNPRKIWPDPQSCVICKKKKRIVEIQQETEIGTNLTSPTAPVKYKKRLAKETRSKNV